MADIKIALVADADNPNVGDLYLENGTIRLTDGLAEEVSQTLRVSLLLFKGEWFLDETQGVPYWQSILGVKTPLSIVQQIFRNAILAVPGVKTINSFTFRTLADRTVSLDFACTLVDDTVLRSSDYAPFIVGI